MDNDKTLAYYGIKTESCIDVFRNAFQKLKDVDIVLLELNTWLDNLAHDYEDSSSFVRHADYVINKVQESSKEPFPLDVIDDAISYIDRCTEHSAKLENTAQLLVNKYAYLQNSLSEMRSMLQESKMEQLALKKSSSLLACLLTRRIRRNGAPRSSV